jgi:uncharacterized phage protein gp47/JayE
MGQFNPKTFEFILARMINRVVARTDLTDINDGSQLKQILAAAAREDDECHFQMINLQKLFDIDEAIGADLDGRAKEFNPSLISRYENQKATGEVQFSRVSTVGTKTIAIGTQITVPAEGAQAEIVFTTTEEGTISGGSTTSNLVDTVAEVAGTSGNVDPNAISAFKSKPSGIDAVTNPAAFTNGRDQETDDEFRARLKAQIKGLARCHIDGIESAVIGVTDSTTGKRVVFSHIVEDYIDRGNATLYVDDGSGTAESTVSETDKSVLASAVGGETVIFLPDKPIKTEQAFVLKRNTVALTQDTDYTLNPASGQINFLPASFPTGLTAGDAITYTGVYFDGLIAEVQKVVDGDAGDRVNYPGYRAAGVLIRVLSPSIQQQIVTANITVLQGFNQVTVAEEVVAAISTYINGLGISGDVILNELRERAMAISGMYDVEFTVPTENKIILDTQLARILTGNMTIS